MEILMVELPVTILLISIHEQTIISIAVILHLRTVTDVHIINISLYC